MTSVKVPPGGALYACRECKEDVWLPNPTAFEERICGACRRDAAPGRVVADGGGLRFNEGKPPLELVPPEVMWALAAVLEHGAKKYAKRNWERGMAWATVYACLLRHLLKWFQGEAKDAESGLSHLDHVLWNAMALVVYERRGIGTDDRPTLGRPVEEKKP